MASVKLAQLAIRTLAKPISNKIKQQAKEHESFRRWCVNLAQRMHRAEVQLRTNLLGESAKSVRPLTEARAIESGANAIAEGFLFSVAALLIISEAWRSSKKEANRRDAVQEQIENLSDRIQSVSDAVKNLEARFGEQWTVEKERNEELSRILSRVVDMSIRGGLVELHDTPIHLAQPDDVHSKTSRDPPVS